MQDGVLRLDILVDMISADDFANIGLAAVLDVDAVPPRRDSFEGPAEQWRSFTATRAVVTAGKWHHVAYSYDGYTISIFIDGWLLDTVTYERAAFPLTFHPRNRYTIDHTEDPQDRSAFVCGTPHYSFKYDDTDSVTWPDKWPYYKVANMQPYYGLVASVRLFNAPLFQPEVYNMAVCPNDVAQPVAGTDGYYIFNEGYGDITMEEMNSAGSVYLPAQVYGIGKVWNTNMRGGRLSFPELRSHRSIRTNKSPGMSNEQWVNATCVDTEPMAAAECSWIFESSYLKLAIAGLPGMFSVQLRDACCFKHTFGGMCVETILRAQGSRSSIITRSPGCGVPDARGIPMDTIDHNDGSYSIGYSLETAGKYNITVSVRSPENGFQLYSGILEVKPSAPNPTKSILIPMPTVDGVDIFSGGNVGVRNTYMVKLIDDYGNALDFTGGAQLSVSVYDGPAYVPVRIIDNDDGILVFSFIVQVEGLYKLAVELCGQPMCPTYTASSSPPSLGPSPPTYAPVFEAGNSTCEYCLDIKKTSALQTSWTSEYAKIPDADQIDLTSEFSISAWIRLATPVFYDPPAPPPPAPPPPGPRAPVYSANSPPRTPPPAPITGRRLLATDSTNDMPMTRSLMMTGLPAESRQYILTKQSPTSGEGYWIALVNKAPEEQRMGNYTLEAGVYVGNDEFRTLAVNVRPAPD